MIRLLGSVREILCARGRGKSGAGRRRLLLPMRYYLPNQIFYFFLGKAMMIQYLV